MPWFRDLGKDLYYERKGSDIESQLQCCHNHSNLSLVFCTSELSPVCTTMLQSALTDGLVLSYILKARIIEPG
jgi:hypothetical protein